MKAGVFALRYAAYPSPAKPSIIIAQVEGSGVPGGWPPPPMQPADAKQSKTSNCFMDLKMPPVPAREKVADKIAAPGAPAGSSKPSVAKSASVGRSVQVKVVVAPPTWVTVAVRSPSYVEPGASMTCPRTNSPSKPEDWFQ
jgi:hypothetical protein